MTDRIEILIIKFLSDSLTEKEYYELTSWIKDENNKKEFNNYISLNYSIELIKSENHDDKLMWKKIETIIKLPPKRNKLWKLAIAASFALLVSIPFILKNDNLSDPMPELDVPLVNNINKGTDKATLTLEDGTKVTLAKGQEYKTNIIESNGKGLIYKSTKNVKSVVEYNYLSVPRGGQYFIELSDGSQIWLNSESQLKYPVHFIEGETRQVELVYGEAYFDISPSKANSGANFKVLINSQEVNVLGTEFNIKAYKDEPTIYTTLIEGKIELKTENENKILRPTQQSTFNLITKNIEVNTVDIYDQISWKDGVFSFKRKPLKEIMKVLSRWYDMNVEFKHKELELIEFIGILDKEQSIQEILETLKGYDVFKSYKINNKLVIIE